MRTTVTYAFPDNTVEKAVFEGLYISTQLFDSGSCLVNIYAKPPRGLVKTFQATRVISIETEETYEKGD